MSDLTQCNHCSLRNLVEREPDKKFVLLADEGWIVVFEIGASPDVEQRIREHEGQPVRWRRSFRGLATRCSC